MKVASNAMIFSIVMRTVLVKPSLSTVIFYILMREVILDIQFRTKTISQNVLHMDLIDVV